MAAARLASATLIFPDSPATPTIRIAVFPFPGHNSGSTKVRCALVGPLAGWVGVGVGLTAAIGIPGLAFYLFARWLGINTDVAAGNLAEHVWTIPVYVLAAFANGLLEETVMVAYLLTRWRQCGWRPGAAVAVSALIRGSYHLYQGFGGFLGNAVMGAACCLYWTRTRRLWPLIVAHTLLDVFSFVGYALLHGVVGWL